MYGEANQLTQPDRSDFGGAQRAQERQHRRAPFRSESRKVVARRLGLAAVGVHGFEQRLGAPVVQERCV